MKIIILLDEIVNSYFVNEISISNNIKQDIIVFHHSDIYGTIRHIWHNTMSFNPDISPFPHTDTFGRLCNRHHLKTLWPKEKLHIMSNYSSCLNVFNKKYFHIWRFSKKIVKMLTYPLVFSHAADDFFKVFWQKEKPFIMSKFHFRDNIFNSIQ